MTGTIALTGRKGKRGNPNRGQPPPPLRALPTEFEMLVKRLGLTKPELLLCRTCSIRVRNGKTSVFFAGRPAAERAADARIRWLLALLLVEFAIQNH
jgi:hypothetical protein